MLVSNITSFSFLIILILVFSSIIRGAPFVPSDKKTVERMIKFAKIKKGEKVVDIGSGDGRLVIALAKAGAMAYGYEINPFLVLWSRYKIFRSGLSGKAFTFWKSFWRVDFSSFDVVTVYAISYIMLDLEKKLEKELKKGTRVVSHTFKFPNCKIKEMDAGVYLYKV